MSPAEVLPELQHWLSEVLANSTGTRECPKSPSAPLQPLELRSLLENRGGSHSELFKPSTQPTANPRIFLHILLTHPNYHCGSLLALSHKGSRQNSTTFCLHENWDHRRARLCSRNYLTVLPSLILASSLSTLKAAARCVLYKIHKSNVQPLPDTLPLGLGIPPLWRWSKEDVTFQVGYE